MKKLFILLITLGIGFLNSSCAEHEEIAPSINQQNSIDGDEDAVDGPENTVIKL